MSQRCFLPGCSYLVVKRLHKNGYFFKDLRQVVDLFLPLLADVTAKFNIECNDYVILPDGYGLILTIPAVNSVGQDSNHCPDQCENPCVTTMNQQTISETNACEFNVRETHCELGTGRTQNEYSAASNKMLRDSGTIDLAQKLGDIPKAIRNLNNNLDRYLKIKRQLRGPIFEAGYDQPVLLDTKEKGLWAHLKLRTLAQVEGFFESNESLGQAILSLDRIGDETLERFERPSCIGANSKVGHSLSLSFPIMPCLQEMGAEEIQRRVAELSGKARQLIREQKLKENVPGYLEEEVLNLPEPVTPRPSCEEVEPLKPSIKFDWMTAFETEDEAKLREQEIGTLENYKSWRKAYKSAIKEWLGGNHESPFPPETYKMRVLHNCKIGDPPDNYD